jgi:uncharacterized lipoprotein YajG
MRHEKVLLAAGLALLLAACGDNPPAELPAPPAASNEVPASATVSITSWSQYAASLTKTETGQPLDVNKVVPPTSETDLPLPVT